MYKKPFNHISIGSIFRSGRQKYIKTREHKECLIDGVSDQKRNAVNLLNGRSYWFVESAIVYKLERRNTD